MKKHKTWLAALCCITFCAQIAALSPAAAQSKKSVVVLPVQGPDKAAAKKLSQELISQVKSHPKFTFKPKPSMDMSELMLSLGCADLDTSCLASIGAGSSSNLVMFGKVKGTQLTVKLVDVKSKSVVKSQTVVANTSNIAGVVTALLGPKKVAPPKPTRLSLAVVTEPRGAKVFMNKYYVGQTPTYGSYLKGEYIIRITKEGFKEHIQRVKLLQKPIRLDIKMVRITLTPTPPVVKKPKKDERPKTAGTPVWKTWWFWTIIGAVVVGGAVTGGVLGARAAKKTSRTYGGVRISIHPANIKSDYSFR